MMNYFFKSFLLISVFLLASAYAYSQKANSDTLTIQTNGKCEMCKERIEEAATSVKGVKSASLDMKNSEVVVVFRNDKTNADAIRKAISRAGYKADDVEPDPQAREKLPGCCK